MIAIACCGILYRGFFPVSSAHPGSLYKLGVLYPSPAPSLPLHPLFFFCFPSTVSSILKTCVRAHKQSTGAIRIDSNHSSDRVEPSILPPRNLGSQPPTRTAPLLIPQRRYTGCKLNTNPTTHSCSAEVVDHKLYLLRNNVQHLIY